MLASQAGAQSVTLEPASTVTNEATVDSYFNGGNDGYPRDGVGPNDEVTFGTTGTSPTDFLDYGTARADGRFENNPSGNNAVMFQALADTMNLSPGYALTSLSFAYSIENNAYTSGASAYVSIWSGLNGTGTLLDTVALSANPTSVTCAHTGDVFCTWSMATASFTGTAESVVWGSTPASGTNGIGETEFDSISMTVVPLPGALPLLLSGVGAFALWRHRRQLAQS
jgi:hypothetical protein